VTFYDLHHKGLDYLGILLKSLNSFIKTQLNMKRFLFLLIFLFLSSTFTFSQGIGNTLYTEDSDFNKAVSFKWGSEIKEDDGRLFNGFIGTDEGGFYICRKKLAGIFRDEKIFLEYIDSSYKLVRSKEIETKHNGEQSLFFGFQLFEKGKLYILTTYYDSKIKKTGLYAQKVNTQTFALEGNQLSLDEVDGEAKEPYISFNIQKSDDSTKLMVKNWTERESHEFTMHVFDSDLKELWRKEVDPDYKSEHYMFNQDKVSNNGNVYSITKHENKKANKNNREPKYIFSILKYTQESKQEEHEYKIALEGKFVVDLIFNLGENEELICAGFYSEKVKKQGLKGSYFMRINTQNNEVLISKTKEFESSFVTANLSNNEKERAAKAKKENDKENETELRISETIYLIRPLIKRTDGGLVLVAEEFHDESRPTARFDSKGWITELQYDDILVTNITPSGEIQWTSRIQKQQNAKFFFFPSGNSSNPNRSSYAALAVRDNLYFTYNDNILNYRPNNKTKHTSTGGIDSVISLAVVDKDGIVKVGLLNSSKEHRDAITSSVCFRTSNNEMIIYGNGDGTCFFTKVTIK
jgi:hypothetical protein